jgi:hypothetical protein
MECGKCYSVFIYQTRHISQSSVPSCLHISKSKFIHAPGIVWHGDNNQQINLGISEMLLHISALYGIRSIIADLRCTFYVIRSPYDSIRSDTFIWSDTIRCDMIRYGPIWDLICMIRYEWHTLFSGTHMMALLYLSLTNQSDYLSLTVQPIGLPTLD